MSSQDISANPGAVVYGTILVAALLSFESTKRQTFETTIGAVAIGLCVYWLAHTYADYAGERAEDGEPFHFSGFARVAGHEAGVLAGAIVPLLVLLACWAAGTALGHAVNAAIWTAIGLIVFTEIALGVRSGLEGRELVVQSAFGVLMGLLVIALRVVLH